MRKTILFLCVAACAALPTLKNDEHVPADALITEAESVALQEEVRMEEKVHARMSPMAMGAMHEPSGEVGRFECRLRAIDRVLRQHPKKYDGVRAAMKAFHASMASVTVPHVADYYDCVVGEGMMLPDCTMMFPVKNTDIATFLKKGGSDKMEHIEGMIAKDEDSQGFAHHWKGVQKIVCDTSVYNAVNGIVNKHSKVSKMKMGSMGMKHMDNKDMNGMDMKHMDNKDMKGMDMKHMNKDTMSGMDMDHDHSTAPTTSKTAQGSQKTARLVAAGFTETQAKRLVQHEERKKQNKEIAVGLTDAQEREFEKMEHEDNAGN